MHNLPKNIQAVDVYLEKRKTRKYVGRLSKMDTSFIFIYDDSYIYNDRSIPLGPDLPFTNKKYISNKLFPTFEDRIPSKKNPAYPEYCKMVGIDPSENDELILVATLGQKGPSSFVFTPVYDNTITNKEIINFRKHLQLTVREFSEIFDIASSTVYRIEKNLTSGKDALKRLEIYMNFPEVALYEIKKNGNKINEKKKLMLEKILKNDLENK